MGSDMMGWKIGFSETLAVTHGYMHYWWQSGSQRDNEHRQQVFCEVTGTAGLTGSPAPIAAA